MADSLNDRMESIFSSYQIHIENHLCDFVKHIGEQIPNGPSYKKQLDPVFDFISQRLCVVYNNVQDKIFAPKSPTETDQSPANDIFQEETTAIETNDERDYCHEEETKWHNGYEEEAKFNSTQESDAMNETFETKDQWESDGVDGRHDDSVDRNWSGPLTPSTNNTTVLETDIDAYLDCKRIEAADDLRNKINKRKNYEKFDESPEKKGRFKELLADVRQDDQYWSTEHDAIQPAFQVRVRARSMIRSPSWSRSRSRSRSHSRSHSRFHERSRSHSHSRSHSQVRHHLRSATGTPEQYYNQTPICSPMRYYDVDRNYNQNAKRSVTRSRSRSQSRLRSRSVYSSSSASLSSHPQTPFKHLSTGMVKELRRQSDAILRAKLTASNMSQSFCFYCEKTRVLSLNEWKAHLLGHTGELIYYCSRCNAESSSRKICCPGYPLMSTFSHSGGLKGYMCTDCDFMKINKQRVIEHMEREHQKSTREAASHVEKVMLLPDLSRNYTPIKTNYKFVDTNNRYCCGVGGCDVICNTPAQLRIHFMQKHQTAAVYLCVHCKDIVKNTNEDADDFFSSILDHLYMHSFVVNQCLTCDAIFYCDTDVISHMLNHHEDNEECKYRRDRRTSMDKKMPRIQEVTVLFECISCTACFEDPNQALRHSLLKHKSHLANFMIIQLVKETQDKVTKYSLDESSKILLFRQFFKCGWCQATLSSKEKLIDHHNAKHPSQDLAIEISKNDVSDVKVVPDFLTKADRHDDYLMFYCEQCYNNPNQPDRTLYRDLDAVYDHWADQHTTHENVKPFRFLIAQLASCRFCNCISTFDGLKSHQKQKHPSKSFVIRNLLDDSKCGLCSTAEISLVKHFDTKHQDLLKLDLFSPIALDNNILNQLRHIKGHKKRRCRHCNATFETKHKFKKHHAKKHNDKDSIYETFYDYDGIHLVAGCCQKKLDPNELFNHLAEHKLSNKSTLRQFYWSTQVIFGNGLVLTKHNLRNTALDDSNAFAEFVDDFAKHQR